MREIKFRVWCKDFNEWEKDNIFIDEWGNLMHVDRRGRMMPVRKDNHIAMLYTGLKDKNGREIYEGDFDQNYDVVRWCDKRNGWSLWAYDHPTKEFVFCHCYSCEGNFELSDLIIGQSEIEIIGNIYENPERQK